MSSYLWSTAPSGGRFVSREAAQEPRDLALSQSWSSDSRKRCAGSDAIVVRGAWKLGEGRSNEVENAKSYTNLRAAEVLSSFLRRSAVLLLLAPLSFSLCATLPAPHPRRRDAFKVHQSPPRSSAETTTHATRLANLRASRKADSTALSRWRMKTAG